MQREIRGAAKETWLWLWAAAAGTAAACCTVAFRELIQAIEWLATGHSGGLVEVARALTPLQRIAVATLGGLLAGATLEFGTWWARSSVAGATHIDYIDAARRGQASLNDRTTMSRSVSALISVGTGASIGREGPMVQLSAWLASWLARWSRLGPEHSSAILACGIAAGIGSAYHAPIAGVVFVLELALGFFPGQTVAPVLIAASTASALIYWFVAPTPLYVMPVTRLSSGNVEVALVLGLLCGVTGWLVLALLERSRRLFALVASPTLRLGLGGLLVGAISAFVPDIWGNGYSVVSQVLQGGEAWPWVALILGLKVAATLVSAGSGALGGIFTPTLFMGATLGYVIAGVGAVWFPADWIGDPRVMAVIGMAAILAAVTHAPLMAIVMVLEMTSQYQLAVPVMLACGAAYATSTHFRTKPIYGNPIEGHR